ncbi:MAG TPA: hypothetical protein VFI32_05620, partial [Rhodanobacteraceae bacterium]|nr:hypothetical protein [Rhodanobacteraceae bacterium]
MVALSRNGIDGAALQQFSHYLHALLRAEDLHAVGARRASASGVNRGLWMNAWAWRAPPGSPWHP